MLKLVVLVALVAAANGASCPAVCSTCFAGGAGGGTSLVGGVCHASCSTSRYCGTSDAYTNGGTDCTGCAETPTASQRANLKLADAHYVTNTKASIAAAELLYKQTVVEFSALFNAGSLLTKSAKKRYNYILDHDSRKPAAEQALLCEDSCSPGGTYTGTGSFAACTANYCDVYQVGGSFRNRCTPGDPNHNFALLECQKTCGICADKTPYAASELSSLLGRRSNDQCSDGEQNGDETGVDCGGSCSVCPVDCVSSETTCTCTPACGNTCDCTDTITITTPAAGRGQACPSATVRTFAGAACPTTYTTMGTGRCAAIGGSMPRTRFEVMPWCRKDNHDHAKCLETCTYDTNCIGYNFGTGWCYLYFKPGIPLIQTGWGYHRGMPVNGQNTGSWNGCGQQRHQLNGNMPSSSEWQTGDMNGVWNRHFGGVNQQKPGTCFKKN